MAQPIISSTSLIMTSQSSSQLGLHSCEGLPRAGRSISEKAHTSCKGVSCPMASVLPHMYFFMGLHVCPHDIGVSFLQSECFWREQADMHNVFYEPAWKSHNILLVTQTALPDMGNVYISHEYPESETSSSLAPYLL